MLVVGCSEPINIDELVRKEGIWFSKDTNKPYSGKSVELWENGQKKFEVTIKDGRVIKLVKCWDNNGNEGNCLRARITGPWDR